MSDGGEGERGGSDRWQLRHLQKSPWMKPEMCGCRSRPDGSQRYKCHRKACDNDAQACGGYCSECFPRILKRSGPRPEVIVLCGSTRFSEEWVKQRYWLTLAGKIVLTIGCDTKSDDGLGITPDQKEMLDHLHKQKIDLADRVLVLNVGGYIGDSTRSEIEYAEWFEKPIDYLIPPTLSPPLKGKK